MAGRTYTMLSSCLPLRSRRCSIIACEMYASCDVTTGGGVSAVLGVRRGSVGNWLTRRLMS